MTTTMVSGESSHFSYPVHRSHDKFIGRQFSSRKFHRQHFRVRSRHITTMLMSSHTRLTPFSHTKLHCLEVGDGKKEGRSTCVWMHVFIVCHFHLCRLIHAVYIHLINITLTLSN